MAYKVPKIPPMRELTLGTNSEHTLDGGLCLDEQSSIGLTQSPILLNMCLDDGGVPKKRPGQTDLFNNIVASFGINDIALSQQITSTLPSLVSTPNLSIIDDGNSNITYSGTWASEPNVNFYGGTSKYSNTTNSYAQYTFIGTGINLYGLKQNNFGICEIFLDGVSKGTVDLYNTPTLFKQKIYSVSNLAFGTHTIKFVVTGTKNASSSNYYIELDYLEVTTNENWRLVTDKSNLNFSTSFSNQKIALLCEMDLTSFCSANYASVNADMEAKFYTVVNNIIASSTGASGSGYDTYVYNYSTSAFELLTTFKVDHISSANKVDLMLYPKYASDGATPCTMNINSFSFNLIFLLLGYSKINGIYPPYKGKTVFAWGTGIYTQTDTNQPILIYSGVTNSKAIFYVYNSMLYFFNGYEFLKYDGTTVSTVTPYIPRHSYNCKPDGSNATIDESWNLIGTGFRRAFNGDGTTKTFQLPYTNLDSTLVTAIVDGVNKIETTDFTVNRATGVVTFTAAPSLSGVLNPNNVEITAYKTFSGYKEKIINCTRVQEAYSVLFLTGNANLPNLYWVGAINKNLDASYFPENREFPYTGTDKACTCFAMHYDTLLIFKENEFSKIEQVTSPTGISTFNRTNINSEIGCDCPDTMQLINNNPTWLTSYGGVYTLQSSLVPGEKNVIPISININGDSSRPGILQEAISDLKNATSFDFNGQYGICLPNGKCYEWEYLRGYSINNPKSMKWYLWDNINASCFFIRDNTLMYGHRLRGQLCKFIDILNDFGSAINGVFSIKLYDFKDPSYEKYVPYCYITTRAGSGSALTVKFIDDQDTTVSTELIPVTETKSFNLDDVDLDNWVWDVQVYAPTIALTPILQSIRYLRIEITNNNINEDLSIVAISLPYQNTRRVI